MADKQPLVRMKTPAYDPNDFPKPPWAARIDLALNGYGTDWAFYAGFWKGDNPGEDGVLSIQAEEGDFVQYGHKHKDGGDKSVKSEIHRVVTDDKGQLVLGEEVSQKDAAKELRKRHIANKKSGNIPERDRRRAAGYMAWLQSEYNVSEEEFSGAQKRRDERAERAAKAKAAKSQEAAAAAEAEGDIPAADF